MPVDHKASKLFIIVCAAASTISILLIMGAILITVLANKNTVEHNKGVIEDMNNSECRE